MNPHHTKKVMLTLNSTVTLKGGVELPWFGLGVWQAQNEQELDGAIKTALGAGYKHIDTAWIYGNEAFVGKSVEHYGKRDELFITTKLWNARHNDAEAAVQDSLKNLRTDYIDLLLIHWPSPKVGNFRQAWKSLVKIKEQGIVKAIGVSNFKQHHIEQILEDTGVVPAVNQVERHPLFQQNEIAAYCREKGIVMEAYSPLGSGNMDLMLPVVAPIAKKYGKTPAQVILRWHLQTNWVIFPKSVTSSRIIENSQIFDFELAAEDIAAINKMDCGNHFLPDPDEAEF